MSGDSPATLADPLYELEVRCPVCNTEPLPSYRLKSKCQTISQDALTIPTYAGIRGHADADLLAMAPTVCPRCLYASPQSEAFTRLGGMTASQQVVLRDMVQEDLLLGHAQRQSVLDDAGVTVADFARPRSAKAAYAAYQLTAWSAAVKAQHRYPRAMSELATAHLYSWHFARQAYGEEAALGPLQKAAKAYAQVFQTGDHEPKNVDQVLYLCIALHLRLGWREETKPFIVAFDRLRERSRALGGDDQVRLRVYQDRIVDLWQSTADDADHALVADW
jgi:uncharacterized protein (DUF2225 family)